MNNIRNRADLKKIKDNLTKDRIHTKQIITIKSTENIETNHKEEKVLINRVKKHFSIVIKEVIIKVSIMTVLKMIMIEEILRK